jgi:hypothetical protein
VIEADAKVRQRTEAFKPVGTGHAMTRQCWTCGKPRGQIGGRLKGRLKLFECAHCIANPPALPATT